MNNRNGIATNLQISTQKYFKSKSSSTAIIDPYYLFISLTVKNCKLNL